MLAVCCESSKWKFTPGLEPSSSSVPMRSTSRHAVSSSCLIVLAFPDSAGGGLGRAAGVSRRSVLFCPQVFFIEKKKIRSTSYRQSVSYYERKCSLAQRLALIVRSRFCAFITWPTDLNLDHYEHARNSRRASLLDIPFQGCGDGIKSSVFLLPT